MTKSTTYYYPNGLSVPLIDRIKHLRRNLTIHSYIYYELNSNIISDHQWQAMADELAMLQEEHPDLCNIGLWDNEFKDWNGSTGMHLSKDPYVIRKAHERIRYRNED